MTTDEEIFQQQLKSLFQIQEDEKNSLERKLEILFVHSCTLIALCFIAIWVIVENKGFFWISLIPIIPMLEIFILLWMIVKFRGPIPWKTQQFSNIDSLTTTNQISIFLETLKYNTASLTEKRRKVRLCLKVLTYTLLTIALISIIGFGYLICLAY